MSYARFAIYYVPPPGALATFGATWLGWDIARGRRVAQPPLPGLWAITATPRKYGFHATLKPPFRLAAGQDPARLGRAVQDLAASLSPAMCDALQPASLGRFLALAPRGDTSALEALAARCVQDLDAFRAPPDAYELVRRRKTGLSRRQDALLLDWGYPYVLEEFRFHMTLTGAIDVEAAAVWLDAVRAHLPDLPGPFVLDRIALCGERDDGRFEVIQSCTLCG